MRKLRFSRDGGKFGECFLLQGLVKVSQTQVVVNLGVIGEF